MAPRLTGATVSPQVVQMYKESAEVLSPPAPQGGGLRWGVSSTLPQSFARVTASMTVALHPPPLPGAYIHSASEEPAWSPAATPAASGPSNFGSRGLCPASGWKSNQSMETPFRPHGVTGKQWGHCWRQGALLGSPAAATSSPPLTGPSETSPKSTQSHRCLGCEQPCMPGSSGPGPVSGWGKSQHFRLQCSPDPPPSPHCCPQQTRPEGSC